MAFVAKLLLLSPWLLSPMLCSRISVEQQLESAKGSSPLNGAQILKRMVNIYDSIDSDKDGKLKANEIEDFVARIAKESQTNYASKEHHQVDSDKDGKLSLKELVVSLLGEGAAPRTGEVDLKSRFAIADKDEDGFLSVEESFVFFNPAGTPEMIEQDIIDVFSHHDTDNDRLISKLEFIKSEGEDISASEEAAILEDFEAFDLNHDGNIDKEEIRQFMTNQGKEEIKFVMDIFQPVLGSEGVSKEDYIELVPKLYHSALTDQTRVVTNPSEYNIDLTDDKLGQSGHDEL